MSGHGDTVGQVSRSWNRRPRASPAPDEFHSEQRISRGSTVIRRRILVPPLRRVSGRLFNGSQAN
jgi:hypothetical protein